MARINRYRGARCGILLYSVATIPPHSSRGATKLEMPQSEAEPHRASGKATQRLHGVTMEVK